MIELLALPEWNASPTTLDDWVDRLKAQGYAPVIDLDDEGASWLQVAPLRLRGYVEPEGDRVGAINFELADPDPAPATAVLTEAALALGWCLHVDEPEEAEED